MNYFKHFICTRFNYGWLDNDRLDKSGIHVNTMDWLYSRCELFEKYCLKSVLEQTNQNFTWLLSFDQRTPKDVIDRYKGLDNITIIHEPIPDHLNKIDVQEKFIITSRIDNDDCYNIHFVDFIQKQFNGTSKLIDTQGIQYVEASGTFYTSGRKRPNCPFLSLIEERRDSIKSVLYTKHHLMPKFYKVKMVKKVLWCQIIHQSNLKNDIRGKPLSKRKIKKISQGFIFPLPLTEDN